MSHAETERTAVREALKKGYGPVYAAGRDYATAYQAAIAQPDLVDAMARTIDLALAAAHLATVAERAEQDARAELARVMADTGCTTVASTTASAHLARRPPSVNVPDPAKLAPEYLHHPPPIPDRAALKRALEGGATIPGATLHIPNEQVLHIRTRSKPA